VVVRGGWGPGIALALAGTLHAADGRTLRAIELRPVAGGTTVVISLSQPTAPKVTALRGEDDQLRRIHVDLPAGIALEAGAAPPGLADPPVLGVRVGRTDGERARVVIDVAGATAYRVEPDTAPGTIVVTIVGERVATAAPPPRPPPQAKRSPAERKAARPKIVIDPGHGGDDPGAEGYAIEKQVTLDIAHKLSALLRVRLGAEVVLTRSGDQTLSLKERTARANREGADLFVSIHANANDTGTLRGIETYYLDNSTDRGTLRLAKMENGLDLLGPTDGQASLKYILSDLVQVGKLEDSARLARQVQRGLVRHLRGRYPGIVDLGVKRGPFYVLVGAFMPCVLVETAFLSHPVEGRRLARDTYRDDVAHGLYTGIARFLGDTSRRRTL
jgi:N-acetylmuramoyl-L-alanine amidase